LIVPKFAYIYGLRDPRDELIYYVGKSDRPQQRKREHLRCRDSNAAKIAWLNDLAQVGLEPELVILQEVLQGEWRETERYWITKGCEDGWPLTNIADGGPNCTTPPDYDFMRGYVRADLWPAFDALSIRSKDAICLETAQAMARSEHPWRVGAMRIGEQVATDLVSCYARAR